MSEHPRIEELRRRVFKDPTSIAFAQLAEEYRRSGRFQEAIEACEAGLAHHPGYLSARVTLGRSLLETGQLDAAQLELQQVLRAAPENLAALRGLAEVHHRRGDLREALTYYRQALDLSRHDPELEHVVDSIRKELEPAAAQPEVVDGLSFEDVKNAFLSLSLPEAGSPQAPENEVQNLPVEAVPEAPPSAASLPPEAMAVVVEPTDVVEASEPAAVELTIEPAVEPVVEPVIEPVVEPVIEPVAPSEIAAEAAADVQAAAGWPPVEAVSTPVSPPADPQIDALQQWLDTIMAERARRHA